MSAATSVAADYRRALEALRNGVPNGDAVRVLGCNQPEVEHRFSDQLAATEPALDDGRQVPGLLVAGGFGTGKSHLFQYLEKLALSHKFVCSRVVISKETPLYDPGKVYRAAIETAVVPRRNGQAIQEIALRLDPRSASYADFYQWANQPDSGVGQLFPATLLLHERLRNDPELVEKITNFWSGESIKISDVRQGLRAVDAAAIFQIRAIRARELALQRLLFAPRLILGAGFRGWVWLIDEVELIGRYSILQRGKSYAELARWIGKIEALQYPGLIVVAAITDDFALAILDGKSDRDYVVPKLQSRGTDEYTSLATRAEMGMRIIEHEALNLKPPDDATLQQTYARLKDIHATAYGWEPPDVPSPDRATSRRMRSYVRRWINAWDLKRLYPGAEVGIEERELRPTYEEDSDIENRSDSGPSGEQADGTV